MGDWRMRVDVQIITKDRHTELALLLQSLREQTFQDFDIWILDDGSGSPVQTAYFIQSLIQRLKHEGHRVVLQRNNKSVGVNRARQQLVDFCIEHSDNELILRQDDDTILERDYLSLLTKGIGEGYDLVSSVTPMLVNPDITRETTYVKPVINRIVLDHEGGFEVNTDDCGTLYTEGELILCDHFRSSALYKKEIHTKYDVDYSDLHAPVSFREEAFLSIRMILAGRKLGVHTGAVAWHLRTPSGGERKPEYNEIANENQKVLNRLMRKLFKRHGDFIQAYHKKHLGKQADENKLLSKDKNTNLIYHAEV